MPTKIQYSSINEISEKTLTEPYYPKTYLCWALPTLRSFQKSNRIPIDLIEL